MKLIEQMAAISEARMMPITKRGQNTFDIRLVDTSVCKDDILFSFLFEDTQYCTRSA